MKIGQEMEPKGDGRYQHVTDSGQPRQGSDREKLKGLTHLKGLDASPALGCVCFHQDAHPPNSGLSPSSQLLALKMILLCK